MTSPKSAQIQEPNGAMPINELLNSHENIYFSKPLYDIGGIKQKDYKI
jgi:hypothetical protein